MGIRGLIAESQPQRREMLRAQLANEADIEIAGLARDGQEALLLVHRLRPDIAILAADLDVQDGFHTAELLAAAADMPMVSILISDTDTPEQIRRAMRAGAREFIAWASVRSGLTQLVRTVYEGQQRRATPSFANSADPARTTRIVAVGGAKGGIGKTTITINLAVALARETGETPVLIDLYTQFGDVTTLLNIEPRRTLLDLLEMGEQAVDAQLLEDCMETHEAGVRVLSTTKSPVALDTLSASFLDTVLKLLKLRYRYVVIDVPPYLHPGTLHAYAHAANVLLVANRNELTTINDTRQLLQTLAGKYVDRQNIAIVMNRLAPGDAIQTADIERALCCPIAAYIPNDGDIVSRSINEGIPFMVSKPNSQVARSVQELARSLVQNRCGIKAPTESFSAAQAMSGRFGKLFGGLLGRAHTHEEAA